MYKLEEWKKSRVLITGVCGTVGRELLHQVVELGAVEVVGIDNNESELFFVSQDYRGYPNVRVSLGDLRDLSKLTRMMEGIDIVLHSAALKHVILCEESPRDAVQTNILGVQNIIDAAQSNNVKRVIFTSSDKAVNPTNVMGTSKLMGERLMTAANANQRVNETIFASTRFGNVLGSRGSVIPLFRRQIANGGPVTLTDPLMTRFIMTIEQAAKLVLHSVFLAQGGEVFVTKMPVAGIEDLAQVMIEVLAPVYGYSPSDIELMNIGSKPGEKLYEELMSDEETRRTIELSSYFAVLPAFRSVYREIEYSYPDMSSDVGVSNPYNSAVELKMTKSELKDFLLSHNLLEIDQIKVN
jgi:FlaA1/EpsC-like NDP-sugar epimerase